jgi:hypothetical protein
MELTIVSVGFVCAAIPSLIGWLLIRAVKGVDKALEGLSAKVDSLAKQDTLIMVELAELRTRVTHLELSFFRQIPDFQRR